MNGINPKDIPYQFSQVTGGHAEHVSKTVVNPEARFRAHPVGAAYIHSYYGPYGSNDRDSFRWDDHWNHVDPKILLAVFTMEECCRLWTDCIFMSDMSKYCEDEHTLLWKINNIHWQFGCQRSWNLLVRNLDALKRLDFGVPGFDVRITHPCSINMVGRAAHGPYLYLDGALGLLLYYKGEHVLTVGFSVNTDGVYIAQVQLRQKKGNRFIYKLPDHYMDMVLDMFRRAFHEDDLWLVEGKSAAAAVVRSYGNGPHNVTPEVEQRIVSLYNRPLSSFNRTEPAYQSGRNYTRLVPAKTQALAA